MYEKHFRLKTRPFGSNAEGAGVFVGPLQAKMIASLQKGIAAPDAVVAVTGQVGVGKTTLVDRALETLPTGRTAARIGRMHLTQEEVVDLLMGGFGIKKTTGGSIRRFAAFRRQLQAQSENGIPVAIVIEDTHRLGADALAEVEALTAADAGDAASANIILMGQPGMNDLLANPALARMKQRIRLRVTVESLSLPEVQGYLKHSIREAGGDYDAIFDAGVADIVFGCSEGIPRVINTLCATAMTTAMEENSARVTAALMNQVARDAFGYEGDTAAVPARAAIESAPVRAPVADAEEDIDWEEPARPEAAQSNEIPAPQEAAPKKPAIGHDMIVESGCYPIPEHLKTPEPSAIEQQAKSEPVTNDIANTNAVHIPELINDTQPELPRLNVPAIDALADIPVLNADSGESDIESTQTLAQPVGLVVDEAVGNEPAAEMAEAKKASGEDFDLDAALSPEVESTNVMPGLTTNLDAVSLEKAEPTVVQKIIEPPPAPVAEQAPKPEAPALEVPDELDLPTLSDSMRVDVEKEVKRANAQAPAAPAAVSPKPAPAQAAAPKAASQPDPVPEPVPEPDPVPEPEPVPVPQPKAETETPAPATLEPATASIPSAVREPIPVSDATMNAPAMRDPLPVADAATRQSDVDALEAALAAAKNGELTSQKETPAMTRVNGTAHEVKTEEAPAEVPEITLDEVIADQQSQLAKLDQFRDEMGDVSSLEDVSDVMAETLFGVEFDEIAAAAIANPNPPEDGYGAHSETAPSPVTLAEDDIPAAANDADKLTLAPPAEVIDVPTSAPSADGSVPLNESTALRIDMLNAMKTKATAMAENVEMGSDNPSDKLPDPKGPQPEPIERQINTSMTQTLEALNVSKVASSIAKEEVKEEKKSGGLFSRFRKSS
jgi:general secretion pathway protein A